MRFSGVYVGISWRGTVSTVSQIVPKLLKQFEPHRTFSTPLKRGVNERRTWCSGEKNKICRLRENARSVESRVISKALSPTLRGSRLLLQLLQLRNKCFWPAGFIAKLADFFAIAV